MGKVADGRGRKPVLSQAEIDEIVDLTRNSKPKGLTHWSVRTMAEQVGVSSATVQRIWSARGLKPHLVKSFKLSGDPRFEEKLIDVLGLYLDPPANAIVLCMDEKSSVQALDRAGRQKHPGPQHLPMRRRLRPGHPGQDRAITIGQG